MEIRNLTHSQLKALINKIAADESIAKAIKSVDTTSLKKASQSKADILASYMASKGLLAREELIKKLYPELDLDAPEAIHTHEYRKASRNLSSILNAVKRQAGERLYSYDGKFALLSEQELKKLHAFHRDLGRATVIRRDK